MRPDEHKSKDSRRYQQKKKKQGDDTAAEIAEERKRRARAQDKGLGIAAIKRRNGEIPTTATVNNKSSGQFSRRKILSNKDRYTERTIQDDLEQDAELGIDRETTNLVNMLEDAENNLTGGSTYFKFKEEQILTPLTTATTIDNEMYQTLLQVDFNALEKKFQQVETRVLLGLSPDDTEVIDCAFEHDYIGLDKPLIPTLNKTSQGAILFKSPIVEKHQHNQKDGIYIRNDRRQSNVTAINNSQQQQQQNTNVDKEDDKDDEELDVLLGINPTNDVSKSNSITADPKSKIVNNKSNIPKSSITKLKVPGTSQKMLGSKKNENVDDQAWLDDILG